MLAMFFSAALLVVAMPGYATAATVLADDSSEPAWAQKAEVTGRRTNGAACYNRLWGKLEYEGKNGGKHLLQELLPDCLAVPYKNPFAITDEVMIRQNNEWQVQNYVGLLSDVNTSPYVTQRYKGQITDMPGHSSSEKQSRRKGSSEIDFRIGNAKEKCNETISRKRSLNLDAFDDFDPGTYDEGKKKTYKSYRSFTLGDLQRCTSFQFPITVVRPGKVVACIDNTKSGRQNFAPISQYFGIVVESQSAFKPLGKMFASKVASSIYHYDVYIHLNDIKPTSGRPIKIGGVEVPAEGRCNQLLKREDPAFGKGFVRHGEVLSLMGASGTVPVHLHLETVVCNASLKDLKANPKGSNPRYVTNYWVGDGPKAVGCRWNRPYWEGAGGGKIDFQHFPGPGIDWTKGAAKSDYMSDDWWNGRQKWFKLLPPYVESN